MRVAVGEVRRGQSGRSGFGMLLYVTVWSVVVSLGGLGSVARGMAR